MEFLQKIYKPSIIALTETWLTNDTPDSFLSLPTYNIYRQDRASRGGGVLIAISDKMISHKINTLETDLEILVTDLYSPSKWKLRVICCYLPPNSNKEYHARFFDTLSYVIKTDFDFLLIGDFNFPSVDWSNFMIPDTGDYKYLYKFVMQNQPLHQLINFPTREDSMLDLLFTNNESFLQISDPLPSLKNSDHAIIHAVMLLETPFTQKLVKNFRKTDYSSFSRELVTLNSIIFDNYSADQLWNLFFTMIQNLISRFVPCTYISSRNLQPWITPYLKQLHNKVKRYTRKVRQSSNSHFNMKLKTAKLNFTHELRNVKSTYEKRLLSNKNPKIFFSYVSRKLGLKCKQFPLICDASGNSLSDYESATSLNCFFSSCFNPDTTLSISPSSSSQETSIPLRFTAADYTKAILSLNPNAAPGPDDIPMFFWIRMENYTSSFLIKLFKVFLNNAYVPPIWKLAKIFPLYKSNGKIHDVKSYRPISLTCSLSKIFEKMLLAKINNHISTSDLLLPNQHGYRRNHSTLTNLLETYHHIANCVDESLSIDLIFLDFQKAFDKVPHTLLIRRLLEDKFSSCIVNWIAEFLKCRFQYVVLNGIASDNVLVKSGVPQGIILAPTLFLLYINDLFKLPVSATLSAYADDVKLYGIVSATESLSKDISAVMSWCSANSMTLNVEKCGVIHFGKNNTHHNYVLSNSILPPVDHYKDLGILIDSRLSFKYHTAFLRKKSFHLCKIVLKSFSTRNFQLMSRVFKTYIIPKLVYGAPFYSPHSIESINQLEKIQRKFTKSVFFAKFHGDYASRLALLDLEPVELLFIKSGLLYIYKVLHSGSQYRSILPPLISSRTRNSSLKFTVPLCKSEFRRSPFPINVISIWNSLPLSLLSCTSLSSFRQGLNSFDFLPYLKGRTSKTL